MVRPQLKTKWKTNFNFYRILYEIKNNCLVPVLNDRDKYGNAGVWVTQVDNDLKVTFYYPDSCWVKEKHLPALIKRKGLVVVK